MSYILPVILSGGSGTRLWPKSRKAYPKQLHTLYGEHTMLQHTALRVSKYAAPIVVCNEAQRFMVAEQLSEISEQKSTIILEPAGRNTAPAIAVAAHEALKQDDDAILVVLPADHLIKNAEAFSVALEKAVKQAQREKLVAFGIVPTSPETGYGYINAESDSDNGAEILKFVEKPNKETAQEYLDSGKYFWNSGMFVFQAKAYLEELAKFEGGMVESAKTSLEQATLDLDFVRLAAEPFETCKDISIDYAVMEQTDKAWMVPLDADWNDLGSWQSLWQALEKDQNGNVLSGDVILHNCKNSFFQSEQRLVAGVGVENLVVIDTDDSLLVVNLGATQDVKYIVDQLKANDRAESTFHRKVYRPWGNYDSIGFGDRFQVKCIEVKPGASLSLQMHHHRAEHWVVVSGTAIVERDKEEHLLSENESIYLPLGCTHRLTNPGKIDLKLIEVQVGSYLGEDDIVRFQDTFGRA